MKYKIGDIVKIIKVDPDGPYDAAEYEDEVGKIGAIRSAKYLSDDDLFPYLIEGATDYWNDNELKLATKGEMALAKLKE